MTGQSVPQVEKAGYKRFWPMRELVGSGRDGKKYSQEGFRDMVTGEFHPVGYNGAPPNYKPGEKDTVEPSPSYTDHYRETFGHD